MDEEKLALRIRRRVYWTMVERGYTRMQLEEKAGVGRGTLSNFFNEVRGQRPTPGFLLRLAKALDVDYGWLCTGREPKPTKTLPGIRLIAIPPAPRGRLANGESWDSWVSRQAVAIADRRKKRHR